MLNFNSFQLSTVTFCLYREVFLLIHNDLDFLTNMSPVSHFSSKANWNSAAVLLTLLCIWNFGNGFTTRANPSFFVLLFQIQVNALRCNWKILPYKFCPLRLQAQMKNFVPKNGNGRHSKEYIKYLNTASKSIQINILMNLASFLTPLASFLKQIVLQNAKRRELQQ